MADEFHVKEHNWADAATAPVNIDYYIEDADGTPIGYVVGGVIGHLTKAEYARRRRIAHRMAAVPQFEAALEAYHEAIALVAEETRAWANELAVDLSDDAKAALERAYKLRRVARTKAYGEV